MSIQKAYDQWSVIYDANENFTRDLDQVITEKILSGQRFRSVLEIGCGTGKNTQLLAQISQQVYAIDFSKGMMTKARKQVQAENVSFCLADVTKIWAIDKQTIDLVVCNLVLEHIMDLEFIFSEVTRVLTKEGKLFISELHPFKQYQGKQANFVQENERIDVQAYLHHISDYLKAADVNGLKILRIDEWWHESDKGKSPRLVSFMFEKRNSSP